MATVGDWIGLLLICGLLGAIYTAVKKSNETKELLSERRQKLEVRSRCAEPQSDCRTAG